MNNNDFRIVPKLVGLVVEASTGKVQGVVDASALLAPEAQAELTAVLTQMVESVQLEAVRQTLEKQFLLPARDIEAERSDS